MESKDNKQHNFINIVDISRNPEILKESYEEYLKVMREKEGVYWLCFYKLSKNEKGETKVLKFPLKLRWDDIREIKEAEDLLLEIKKRENKNYISWKHIASRYQKTPEWLIQIWEKKLETAKQPLGLMLAVETVPNLVVYDADGGKIFAIAKGILNYLRLNYVEETTNRGGHVYLRIKGELKSRFKHAIAKNEYGDEFSRIDDGLVVIAPSIKLKPDGSYFQQKLSKELEELREVDSDRVQLFENLMHAKLNASELAVDYENGGFKEWFIKLEIKKDFSPNYVSLIKRKINYFLSINSLTDHFVSLRDNSFAWHIKTNFAKSSFDGFKIFEDGNFALKLKYGLSVAEVSSYQKIPLSINGFGKEALKKLQKLGVEIHDKIAERGLILNEVVIKSDDEAIEWAKGFVDALNSLVPHDLLGRRSDLIHLLTILFKTFNISGDDVFLLLQNLKAVQTKFNESHDKKWYFNYYWHKTVPMPLSAWDWLIEKLSGVLGIKKEILHETLPKPPISIKKIEIATGKERKKNEDNKKSIDDVRLLPTTKFVILEKVFARDRSFIYLARKPDEYNTAPYILISNDDFRQGETVELAALETTIDELRKLVGEDWQNVSEIIAKAYGLNIKSDVLALISIVMESEEFKAAGTYSKKLAIAKKKVDDLKTNILESYVLRFKQGRISLLVPPLRLDELRVDEDLIERVWSDYIFEGGSVDAGLQVLAKAWAYSFDNKHATKIAKYLPNSLVLLPSKSGKSALAKKLGELVAASNVTGVGLVGFADAKNIYKGMLATLKLPLFLDEIDKLVPKNKQAKDWGVWEKIFDLLENGSTTVSTGKGKFEVTFANTITFFGNLDNESPETQFSKLITLFSTTGDPIGSRVPILYINPNSPPYEKHSFIDKEKREKLRWAFFQIRNKLSSFVITLLESNEIAEFLEMTPISDNAKKEIKEINTYISDPLLKQFLDGLSRGHRRIRGFGLLSTLWDPSFAIPIIRGEGININKLIERAKYVSDQIFELSLASLKYLNMLGDSSSISKSLISQLPVFIKMILVGVTLSNKHEISKDELIHAVGEIKHLFRGSWWAERNAEKIVDYFFEHYASWVSILKMVGVDISEEIIRVRREVLESYKEAIMSLVPQEEVRK